MKKQKLTTKIIGGKYKGKLLELPSLDTTRSSKSILKESFFNVLQFDIIDTVFIEVFGGSGSIGLEAISRDAKEAYFIEKDRYSFKILQKNCSLIDPDKTTCILGDSFEHLPKILNNIENNPIIVYIDPPFDFRDGMEDIYEKSFNMVKNFNNNNIFLVTFEHLSTIDMPKTIGKFNQFKTKKFGKSSLTYYQV